MAEAPAVERTGFQRVYKEDLGVTINTNPYGATVTTPTILATSLPDGSVLMAGWEGIDIIFAGTDTDNDDFNFEIWFYYLVRSPTADDADWMWLPKLAVSSGTSASANQLGTFAGVNGEYVENELTFADTIAAITKSSHQTLLEAVAGLSNDVVVESPGSNGVAMVSIRSVSGAHAVRIHPYEDGTAGNAIRIQPFVRLTRGIAHS